MGSPCPAQLGQGWATWLLWLIRVYGFALLCPKADEQAGSPGSAPSGEWEELDRAYAAANFKSQHQPELEWRTRRRFGKIALVRMTYKWEGDQQDTGRKWCWWTKRHNNHNAPTGLRASEGTTWST